MTNTVGESANECVCDLKKHERTQEKGLSQKWQRVLYFCLKNNNSNVEMIAAVDTLYEGDGSANKSVRSQTNALQ